MAVEVVELNFTPAQYAEAERITEKLKNALTEALKDEASGKKPLDLAAMIYALGAMAGGFIKMAPQHMRGKMVARLMSQVADLSGGVAIVAEIRPADLEEPKADA